MENERTPGPAKRQRPKRRRARGHTKQPDGTPVVRLDIYASLEGAAAREAPPALESRSHVAELDERERALAGREQALAEREAKVRVELDFREDELEVLEQALAEQETRLARKESELAAYVGQLQGRLTVVR